jgi:chemotaxis protein MotA
MLVIVGYIIILGAVFGGFVLSGGHIAALIQPLELLMIGGAAAGTFLASNNMKTIKAVVKSGFSVLKSSPYNKDFYRELLSLLFLIANKIKREGIITIEADINDPQQSPIFSQFPLVLKDHHAIEFMQDYLRLMVTGLADFFQMENLMDNDIETHHHEGESIISAITKVADAMPAFGIVAAVMGVVHTMASVGLPPAQLGELVAKALVGTFLGILLGYGFIAPVATMLEQRLTASTKALQCIKVILLASINNCAPSVALEFGRKVLFSAEKPTNAVLEDMVKELKAK